MVNTFKYTRQLEEVGFSREQAEIQLQIITEIVEGDLATKQDLNTSVERLDHKMLQMEYRLFLKIVAAVSAVLGVFVALMKIL